MDAHLRVRTAEGARTPALHIKRKLKKLHDRMRFEFSTDIPESMRNEDYRVNDHTVELPGFTKTKLAWTSHDNVDEYYYDGQLGWIYSPNRCLFRCFSPHATQVSVVLYYDAEGDHGRTVVPMQPIPEGCWKADVHEDLRGRYYKLLAESPDKRLFPGVEVIDPYSTCNTSHTGRGLIFGNNKTYITDSPKIAPHESIIYELHIRDATIDHHSGVSCKGKFLGLTERNTKLIPNEENAHVAPDGALSTGLDHIIEMGPTVVQILPWQDFDNDEHSEQYRWGYMPVHFNSPDGWYATNTYNESRVTELKMMIDAFHKAGIKVVMDVVYNHTAEDSNEFNLEARFSFNGLAPRYYYRTCGSNPVSFSGHNTCAWKAMDEPRCGHCYSNGSGCGNEFRSEAPMARKFLIDSLLYWVREYKVDGFRFDLMGLIDRDSLTIAAQKLHDIDPNILVYGEPWTGGPTPIAVTDKGSQRGRGFGVFNNTLRDSLRGSPFGIEECYLMDGGRLDELKKGILGSIHDFTDSPTETINYIECHDNRTLYDHFCEYRDLRNDDIQFYESDLVRMHKLGAVVVFTSQGMPFMQMGQEMCRTKNGVENSYESPDEINKIHWNWKIQRYDVVSYYRGLIALRKAHPEVFSMANAQSIRDRILFFEDMGLSVPDRCVAYRIMGAPLTEEQAALQAKLNELPFGATPDPPLADDSPVLEALKWRTIIVILNATPVNQEFRLPALADGMPETWFPVVNEHSAGPQPCGEPIMYGFVTVPGRSAMVLRNATVLEKHLAIEMERLEFLSDP